MRAVLRLEVVGARRFDAQLATIGESRLIRTPQGSYLEVDVTSVVAAVRSSALAGVRAIACDRDFTPGVDTMPALASGLEPLDPALVAIDVVEARPVPLAEASAALLSPRDLWRTASRDDRDRCRRLLRDEDDVLAWRRIVWCPTRAVRAVAARARLRPVVFDRDGLDRAPFRWTHASDGAIARWLFA